MTEKEVHLVKVGDVVIATVNDGPIKKGHTYMIRVNDRSSVPFSLNTETDCGYWVRAGQVERIPEEAHDGWETP